MAQKKFISVLLKRRSPLEGNLHSVEIELESIRVQLEEEAEACLDLERQLSKVNQDCLSWKSKYEHYLHFTPKRSKKSGLEKSTLRLQSEVDVLIIDLKKANSTAREMQKRSKQLELINIEFKSKLDKIELTVLYDASQRYNHNKATEISRLTHELDKTRERKDQLTRENKKLGSKFIFSEFHLLVKLKNIAFVVWNCSLDEPINLDMESRLTDEEEDLKSIK
ncbi:hypothetical protein DAPPUDRAFT_114594 [Daphnia pulex]|uniref:Uncharacterized protein n=1 Tax=Daphnia pulex TaxID=6669 RepID=E9HIP3_DAPPU|nr:hypothetical protein DAPPUDRAFT_114594 [Daphnia pulex]|eukprot:EFX68388.1 hypothetical protein DAPPUDRAFT_114594 [Daphnia pulex]